MRWGGNKGGNDHLHKDKKFPWGRSDLKAILGPVKFTKVSAWLVVRIYLIHLT